MLNTIANLIHVLGFFLPIIFFVVPVKYVAIIFKYIFLIYILVPIQWSVLNNKCILSLLVKKNGGLKNTKSDSIFAEVYMKWLYYPLLKLFGQEWTPKNINYMVLIHFTINLVLLWVYLFFVGKGKLM
jgi:hypothetical protein